MTSVQDENYYKILGVDKKADVKEIRSAYKELSKIHHPDKGGDEEMFKKIGKAHEVLSDPERRQMYDLTGSDQEKGGPPGGGGFPFGFPFGFAGGGFHMNVDMNDLFGNMFGGNAARGGGQQAPHTGRRHVRRAKGANKVHEVPLSLHDYFFGKRFTIDLHREVFCDMCHGEGCAAWKTCEGCRGAGVKEVIVNIGPGMMAVNRGPCGDCRGEGRLRGPNCRECEGKGVVPSPKMLTVDIQAGSRPNDILEFPEMCSDHPEFEKPGDVHIRLVEAAEDLDIEREGDNLFGTFTVSLAESLLGCIRVIRSHPAFAGPDGLPVEIPAGTQSGEILRIAGKGMPKKGESGAGDLLIKIIVEVAPVEREALLSHKAILQSVFITSK